MITKNSLKPSESSCQLALTLKLQHALTQTKPFLFQDQFTSLYIYIYNYIYHTCVFLVNMSFSPFISTEHCRLGLFLRSAWYGRLAHTTATSPSPSSSDWRICTRKGRNSRQRASWGNLSAPCPPCPPCPRVLYRALSHAQIILSQWGMEFWCFGVWTKPHAKTSRPMSERFYPRIVTETRWKPRF